MNISYVCLIYKSVEYLKFLHQQFFKFTKLNEGDEFYFVANDPTDEVLDYLQKNKIKHYIHLNNQEQKKEWYINNVYRAWNTSIKMAKCEYILFLNSDFAFSKDWVENLKNNITDDICVCSRLVERGLSDGGLSSGQYGIEKSFGNSPHNYKEMDFNIYAKNIEINELRDGGLFMPLLIKKKYLEQINYYPEGNVLVGSDIFNPKYATLDDIYKNGLKCISGDIVLMQKLKTINIKQFTSFNSIVYHFQEGEMKSNDLDDKFHFYGSKNEDDTIIPLYIYYSKDYRMRIEFDKFDRNDGWEYSMTINTYKNNDNCNEYFIYRINENLVSGIFENTIISKAKPETFLINNGYYFINSIYLKNYNPQFDNLKNTIKYYYNNTNISIIDEYII
jgi:hypothetical protein